MRADTTVNSLCYVEKLCSENQTNHIFFIRPVKTFANFVMNTLRLLVCTYIKTEKSLAIRKLHLYGFLFFITLQNPSNKVFLLRIAIRISNNRICRIICVRIDILRTLIFRACVLQSNYVWTLGYASRILFLHKRFCIYILDSFNVEEKTELC